MKLSELAAQTGATCSPSDGDIEIEGAAGLDQAGMGQVTFLSNPRYASRVNTTAASAIYVGEDAEVTREDLAVLRAKDPYLAFTRALILFHPTPAFTPAIHPSAVIDPTANVAHDVFMGAHEDVVSNIGSWIDYRRRMNCRCERRRGMKENQGAGEREIGILGAQDRQVFAGYFGVFANVNRRRRRGVHP